jgi:hypothetical protein
MAEEAQELTVTHTGQPQTVDLLVAQEDETLQDLVIQIAAAVSVDLYPAED